MSFESPSTASTTFLASLRRSAPVDVSAFFTSAAIVVDANVLLSLYRFTAGTRAALLDSLTNIAPRLWIPYQVASEFGRNRQDALVQRSKAVSALRAELGNAAREAALSILKPVETLLRLREDSGTTVVWEPKDYGLDGAILQDKLNDVLAPARDELKRLLGEHDLDVGKMADDSADEVLASVEGILGANIGPQYKMDRLRDLVDAALEFRYPNKIPPGYCDAHKTPEIRAAGDYLLWMQTMDHFRESPPESGLVLLVTNDTKEDWWESAATDRRPTRPRIELLQEFFAETGLQLHLVTTRAFLEGLRIHLGQGVPDSALTEVDVIADASRPFDDRDGIESTPLPYGIAKALSDLAAAGFSLKVLGSESDRLLLFALTDRHRSTALLAAHVDSRTTMMRDIMVALQATTVGQYDATIVLSTAIPVGLRAAARELDTFLATPGAIRSFAESGYGIEWISAMLRDDTIVD